MRALPYHAGLSDEERSRNQDAFLDEHADVVVATVAFGMGIDRSDVRFVVHAGAPQSLEHYQQESGRAGRDGLEAECVLIYSTRRLPEVARHARAERRADRRARARCCATWSATPRASAAAIGISSAYFGERYAQDGLRRLRLLPRRARGGRRPGRRSRARSCRAWRASGSGSAPRTSPTCCAGSASEQVDRARPRHAEHVRPAARTRRSPEVRGYIEQLIGHGLLRQTDDRVSRAGADRRGRRAAEGRRGAARTSTLARQRTSDEGSTPQARRESKPSRGRASIATCSSGCARCGSRSRARAACRPTSSSTTRRCARWRGCKPTSLDALLDRLRRRRAQGRGSRRGVRESDSQCSSSQFPVSS